MPHSRAPKRGLCYRPDQTWQGHQDRRYRLWQWSSSRRHCRKRFACRVQACGNCSGRMLPRRAPRKADRGQSVRFGRSRPDPARRVWHRDDRAQPGQPWQNAGWPPTASLQAALESGTAVCLDAELPPSGHSMGVSCRKLPWLRSARLCPDAAQAFMRWLLVLGLVAAWIPAQKALGVNPVLLMREEGEGAINLPRWGTKTSHADWQWHSHGWGVKNGLTPDSLAF